MIRKKLSCVYPYSYHFWWSPFLCVDPYFHLVSFPFSPKDSLQYFLTYSTNLPVVNSFSVCVSEKVFISTSFWKTFLQGAEVWVDRCFFFQCCKGSGPSQLPWSQSLLSFSSLFLCTECVLFPWRLLTFSPAVFNLPLISSGVFFFFTSDVVVHIPQVEFAHFPISYMSLLTFWNTWNIVTIVLTPLSANSNICVSSRSVSND